jgi:hypothetical protein
MQTIVAHFVDMDNYPMHKRLIEDKYAFREELCWVLNKNMDEVKQIISAADNGKPYRDLCECSSILQEYVQEASTLVDSFLEVIQEHNPDLLDVAKVHAKHIFEIIAWEKKAGFAKKQPKLQKTPAFNKYSLFFFVWTQIEREIRHAMMNCFSGFVHEVHDAVYSKEVVDISILEQTVLEQTGISVKIEH